MQQTTVQIQARQCLRCHRFPKESIETNKVFQTHICYPDCGNLFWTLKQCINCKAEHGTRIIEKPKTGQLVACAKCNYMVYYFRCPYDNCKALIYENYNNYIMGQPITCYSCQRKFKLIVCPCGGEIFIDPSQIIVEGMNVYTCRECKKNVVYTICTECFRPQYHKDKLEIGNRYKCGSCLKVNIYVPCPTCGRSIASQKFCFGQTNKCSFCSASFEFSNCPMGCGTNYYNEEVTKQPLRKCSGVCGMTFLAVTCMKCYEPLYMDEYYIGVGREQQCPSCRKQIKFYYCSCGMLSLDTKCFKASCPPPKEVISFTKKWKEEQEKKKNSPENANNDYDEKTCKLCYGEESCMINEQCKHIMMCEPCFREYQKKKPSINNNWQCPICKTHGRYYKYAEPIYA